MSATFPLSIGFSNPQHLRGYAGLFSVGLRTVSESIKEGPKFSLFQVVQSVLATIIAAILLGIYNNYSDSLKAANTSAVQTTTQLAQLNGQVLSIQEKVSGIPTIQSDLVALKVQNAELQRRVSDLEHRNQR